MTRIDRILALDPDDVGASDVYFLMRIVREACNVGDGLPLNELFRILDEEDEVADEPVGVHRTHCCKIHGCKYESYEDQSTCPVVLGKVEQIKGYGWCQEPELVSDPEACRGLGVDRVGDPGPWEATADPNPEYEIVILDQGFEPGTYDGWSVQFQAIGAPRLSYQKQDPILEAFVRLEKAPENAPKLGKGGSTALARASDGPDIAAAMMAGGAEGNVLRGFTGAALVESMPVVHGNAPVALPSDERIIEACQRSLRAHIEAVKAEQARLAVTETTESSVVGKRLRVKG